jgi:eukaryotic-like serine/threonine-protein kinase
LYTAPEITQDLKYASVQSDIYSLGCILHDFVCKSQRIPCNEISESTIFGDLLLSATRKDPSRRFSSVKSFREALNSITQQVDEVKTEIAEIIKEKIEKPITEFGENDISDLSDFLNSDVIPHEKDTILSIISLQHIEIINKYPYMAQYIAKTYFSYVRYGNFPWDFCDTLASRVTEFMKLGSVDIISEGIFALLYMGTHHNRWHVERIAASFLKGNIESHLLRRIEMECRVDGKKFCRAFDHLMASINESLPNFNEKVQEVYKTVGS